jgi:hypothetical protein
MHDMEPSPSVGPSKQDTPETAPQSSKLIRVDGTSIDVIFVSFFSEPPFGWRSAGEILAGC